MLYFTNRIACCLVLVSLAGAAQAGESIAYRLSKTKEMHFDDARKAELHLAAVKKLGCEARMDSHGGHTDVIYRSTRWQSMEVATDKLAHQWEDWLKKAGFETLHGHAADHAQDGHAGHSHVGHNHGPGAQEQVAYQMDQWRTLHFEDSRQASEIIAMMRGLGCELQTENHAGHSDIRIRCTQWKHNEFSSHQAAQIWEDWLKKQGFTVKHVH